MPTAISKTIGWLLVMVFICITSCHVRAAEPPGDQAKNTSGIVDKAVRDVVANKGLPNPMYLWVGNLTAKLKLQIQDQSVDAATSVWSLFKTLVLVFCLGLIHILGPGHLKTAAGGYVVATADKTKDGLFMGLIMGAIPGVLALSIVTGNYYSLFGDTGLTSVQLIAKVKTGALVLILLTGIVLTGKRGHKLWKQMVRNNDTGDSHYQHPVIGMMGALLIGTMPCVEIIYMIGLGLAQSRMWLGMILSAALITGMGCALLIAGGLLATVKGHLLRLVASRWSRLAATLEAMIELIASVCVAGAGGLMLLLI